MPAPTGTRVRVFAAAVAFYLAGVSAAVLTGVPSGMAVSVVLVATAAWAFGPRGGAAAVVVDLSVGGLLFGTGALTAREPPAVTLVPVLLTDAVVVVGFGALRAAERRRDAVEAQLRAKNAELEATLAEVKELRGMLPICAWCKCVRDVNGLWNRMEAYIARHSHATFTHGICPTCAERMAAEP